MPAERTWIEAFHLFQTGRGWKSPTRAFGIRRGHQQIQQWWRQGCSGRDGELCVRMYRPCPERQPDVVFFNPFSSSANPRAFRTDRRGAINVSRARRPGSPLPIFVGCQENRQRGDERVFLSRFIKRIFLRGAVMDLPKVSISPARRRLISSKLMDAGLARNCDDFVSMKPPPSVRR